jgi:hypothetical protein
VLAGELARARGSPAAIKSLLDVPGANRLALSWLKDDINLPDDPADIVQSRRLERNCI